MKKLIFLFVLCAAPLAAENCFSSCQCCAIPNEGYIWFNHREPGGIGYPRGYTSIEILYAPSYRENLYGFLDVRGHIFNDGKWATNFGFGIRKLSQYCDIMEGFNFYWDWRDAKHHSFHQIGLGYEFLTPYWDFHLNGYLPIGAWRKSTFRDDPLRKRYEVKMSGFDASVGYWLFKCPCISLHTSLGGYYFQGQFRKEFGGGFATAKLNVWEYIELEGHVSYDNTFKWIGQGELALRFPIGSTLPRYPRQTSCCADVIALEERILEQPQRFEILITTSYED